MCSQGLFGTFLKIRTRVCWSFLLCVMVMVASLLNWTSAVMASPSSCLTHDRAARTWPGKELTKDPDGCWTFWRKGLPHLFNDTPPAAALIKAATDEAPPPAEKLWTERWPEVVEVQRPSMFVKPEDPPLVTRHTIAIVIISVVMILAIIETLTGKIVTRRFKK